MKPKYEIPLKKTAYSCYLEVQLEYEDFGFSRRKHNAICNKLLLAQLIELNREGIQFCEEISNDELINNITSNPKKSPHDSLIWEHCHTLTVRNRSEGVMRLVPETQHSASSEFWRTFHPGYNNRGGYQEWAIPRGAPIDKPKNYPPDIRKEYISKIKSEELADYLLVAVKTNKLDKFTHLLEQAKHLSISPQQLQTLITQTYYVGKRKKPETLLHLASANGQLAFVNQLMAYFNHLPDYLQLTNYQGNTPVHIAAKNNRPLILRHFRRSGADLSIKNKKQATAYDIAQKRNFRVCLPFCTAPTSAEIREEKQAFAEHTRRRKMRDPVFVYGDMRSPKTSAHPPCAQNAAIQPTSAPRKGYRELIGLSATPEANSSKSASTAGRILSTAPPRKSYRELIGLPAQPTQEELEDRATQARIATETPRKSYRELIGLPAQPTQEELEDRATQAQIAAETPRKNYRELMGLPAQLSQAELAKMAKWTKIAAETSQKPARQSPIPALTLKPQPRVEKKPEMRSLPQKIIHETRLPKLPLNRKKETLATSIAIKQIINQRIERERTQKHLNLQNNDSKQSSQKTIPQQNKESLKQLSKHSTLKNNEPKLIPKVQHAQTMPQRTQPPVMSQRTQPPVTSQRTQPPVMSQRTQPPVTSQRTQPPVMSQRTQPPVMSQRTQPPVMSQRTQPSVISQRVQPSVMSQRTQQQSQQAAAQRAQQAAAQKAQQLATQKAQQLAAQKAQQLAAQKAQQLAAQKAQQLAAQRAQQAAAQRAQQAAAQKAAQQASSRGPRR